jgi:hypothetical protein
MRRNILVLLMILIVSVVSIFGYQTYQDFTESQEFNSYLESASLISSLHKQSSEQFESLLDFSEISREDFESIINNIVSNAKEAYEINSNISSEINRKERELLNLSVIYWLQGLELFEASIITLIDNPTSQKIEESIAQSIADLSIGDRSYSEFLDLVNQNADLDGTFLPVLYNIEYIGIEDNSKRFADLLVDKAQSGTGGLFLRRNLAVTGSEFIPTPIAFTEEDYAVLLDEEIQLQIVLSNNGNVDAYDVVVLVLVTDEFNETVFEQQSKINNIGPQESKIFITDAISIEKGKLHEWFIKIEAIEKEEDLNDNLYRVYGFIPPES